MTSDMEPWAYLVGLADAMPPGAAREHWVEQVARALDAIRSAREALDAASERHGADNAHGGAR
jgi:hypothetical protein